MSYDYHDIAEKTKYAIFPKNKTTTKKKEFNDIKYDVPCSGMMFLSYDDRPYVLYINCVFVPNVLKVPWTYSDNAIRKHFPEMHR